jgi:hypothetical protein
MAASGRGLANALPALPEPLTHQLPLGSDTSRSPFATDTRRSTDHICHSPITTDVA